MGKKTEDSEKGFKITLQGQIALITNGAGPTGIAIANQLLCAGAAVAISDTDASRLASAYSHLAEVHDKEYLATFNLDVADRHNTEKGLEHISRKFGGFDIAVLNAAEQSESCYERVISALTPIFKRQGTGGNIVILTKDRLSDPMINFGAQFQTFLGFFGSQIFFGSQCSDFSRFQTPAWVRVNRIICPNDGSLLPEHIGNAVVFFASDLTPVNGAVFP
jgi:NAD(P)-dependent dehydrogenase (short-subunit alcohol dehydrogenase family)